MEYSGFFVLLGAYLSSGQVPRDQLFPFGSSNGDIPLEREVISRSDLITLMSPFTFFNRTYLALYVHSHGTIVFSQTSGFDYFETKCNSSGTDNDGPLIAPFCSMVNIRNGGHIHYRETTNPSLISKAQDEVKKGFPDVGRELAFKSVFIATWDNVAHDRYPSCPDDKLRNTFQAILASDGKKSFVIFYYNELTWTHSTRTCPSGTCGSRFVLSDAYSANAGFTAGSTHAFQYVLRDCESNVLKLMEKSNMGEMGKWVFNVDKGIESPTLLEYKDFTNSASSDRIMSSIGIYYYVTLVTISMCVLEVCI